jgi:hypothetical protein
MVEHLHKRADSGSLRLRQNLRLVFGREGLDPHPRSICRPDKLRRIFQDHASIVAETHEALNAVELFVFGGDAFFRPGCPKRHKVLEGELMDVAEVARGGECLKLFEEQPVFPGSARESDRWAILGGFPDGVNSDEFDVGHSHTLGL